MSVWNWKIDVGIFEIFLEACDTMARSLRFKLLRYYYCMMLSDTVSTKPPHSLGSQRLIATRGNWFPPRAVGGGVN
jgi:hypothetical protein